MSDPVASVVSGILQQQQPQQAAKATQGAEKQRDKQLWEASRQFEAIFVQQMMSEIRKTVPHSGFINQGFAEDIHASMMDEAIAQASTHHSTFGIADAIYRQLSEAQNGIDQAKQAAAQENSVTADKVLVGNGLTMEANGHAD